MRIGRSSSQVVGFQKEPFRPLEGALEALEVTHKDLIFIQGRVDVLECRLQGQQDVLHTLKCCEKFGGVNLACMVASDSIHVGSLWI